MVGKKKKKSAVRPVVSLRVRPAMYEDLIREAQQRRLKLSEEVERRLLHYDELIADQNMVDDATLGSWLNTDHTDEMINKLADRLAKAMKRKE